LQPLDARSVKEWRHRRMLSQQEVADRAGTSLFTIQRIERGEGNVRPKTGRAVAAALGVSIEELLPKDQAPPHLQPSFNGLLAEERRYRYLRSWRAFVWKLVQRWEKDPPKTSQEIVVVLDTMQALIDEGAFQHPPAQVTTSDEGEASEVIDLQALFFGLQRLNRIADTVKGDETAQQRRELLKALPGGLSA
jgi:transcriptional regulator with XRE-family HTH domain